MVGLLSELSPPIARVIINRPEKRNALSSAQWLGLRELAARIAADPAIRVALLQGSGEAAFSAGADIAEMQSKSQFVEISSAGIRESHVHDVQITKEAPNYRAD